MLQKSAFCSRVTSSYVFVSKIKIGRLIRLMTQNMCVALIPSLFITSQLKDQSHAYVYLQKYLNIFLDKQASHNFKYLPFIPNNMQFKTLKESYIIAGKIHLVHVSQLVIDFHFKDIFSTNKNMKRNIFCFLIIITIISFLPSSIFSV